MSAGLSAKGGPLPNASAAGLAEAAAARGLVLLATRWTGAEQIAAWAAGARVEKAFHTVGFNVMANPRFNEGAAVMFYCGDDAAAKTEVGHLVSELGFDAVDAGPRNRLPFHAPLLSVTVDKLMRERAPAYVRIAAAL